MLKFSTIARLACVLLALMFSGCAQQKPARVTATVTGAALEALPLGRLPQSVTPISYSMQLDTDPNLAVFSGGVQIEISLSEAKQQFWIHGQGLRVSRVLVKTGVQEIVGSYAQKDESGVALLSFARVIPAGSATLLMEYSADYSPKLDGLYKVTDAGRNYLFTQFESIFARQMFPGFDEPGFKTPFSIQISIPKHMRAIGNTPISTETLMGDHKQIQFQTTKKLPTYLLALAIGELDIVEFTDIPANEIRKEPLALRGVATFGKGAKMQYALSNTAPILLALEQYFGSPYPYEKLDIIAVPDFNSGAMENAGAITYRETLLLMNDDAPMFQKVAYTGTHTHELAHQWFGNLVTPVWWDDIWLNEAFATWMASKIAGRAQPTFNFQNRTQSGAFDAMDVDAFASARQIRNPVGSRDEIIGAFDSITYRKGGGVLAMFESYLGEDRFQAGVRLHMQRFAHGNATASDFLRSLSDAAQDPNISASFESFLNQSGVPSLAFNFACDANSVRINAVQTRYTPLGLPDASAQRWQIPLCVLYPTILDGKSITQTSCELVTEQRDSWNLQQANCPAWILPNANGAAYARFTLPAPQFALLAQQDLPPASLLSLHDSMAAALYSGTLDSKTYLTATEKLAANADANVAIAPMLALRQVLQYGNAIDKARIRSKILPIYLKRLALIGLNGDSTTDKDAPAATAELRLKIAEFAVLYAQDTATTQQFAELGSEYLGLAPAGGKTLPVQLRGVALAASIRVLGMRAQTALKDKIRNASDAVFRGQALSALGSAAGSTTNRELQKDALAFSLDASLRVNELLSIANQMSTLPAAKTEVWAWLSEQTAQLIDKMPEKSHSRILDLAGGLCSNADAALFRAHFEPQLEKFVNGSRTFALVNERIARCSAVRAYLQ
jgi:cytosol alanyl aminopeptidase